MADGSLQVLALETGQKLGEIYPLSSRIQKTFKNSLKDNIIYSLDMHKNLNEWKPKENKMKNLATLPELNITSMQYTKNNLIISLRKLKIVVIKNS